MTPRLTSQGIVLIVVSSVFPALSIVAICLRIWARRLKGTTLDWSDYTIFFTMVGTPLKSALDFVSDSLAVECFAQRYCMYHRSSSLWCGPAPVRAHSQASSSVHEGTSSTDVLPKIFQFELLTSPLDSFRNSILLRLYSMVCQSLRPPLL